MSRPWSNSAWAPTVGGVLASFLLWPLAATAAALPGSRLEPARRARFEAFLEEARRELKIPGLSVAIVSGGRLAWARGFGLADVGRGVDADPTTPYHLASVTKPLAAVLALQLAEEGVLDLDDPVTRYGLRYPGSGVVRIRHLLSHTSHGDPGAEFRYDSDRYADLGWIFARASGRSFRQLLVERILVPLGMEDSAPTPLGMGDGILRPFQVWLDPRNARVYRRLARAYALDRSFSLVEARHPILFSPAGGLVSSASDLARFDVALDSGRLLPEAARARMLAPVRGADGRTLPYGLGWFTQVHAGTRLVWHYGWNPPTASALYLKLPDEDLTFIALANTDALSRPFELGRSDSLALDSLVALAFYEAFVLEPRRGGPPGPVDWDADEAHLLSRLLEPGDDATREILERELTARRRVAHAMGRAARAERLRSVYSRLQEDSSGAARDLPPLGDHLRPWPTAPLFGMSHVVALMWFLIVGVSTLGLWAGRAVRVWSARRGGDRDPKPRTNGRFTTALATVTILAGVALYVALLSRWPHEGAFAWTGGSPLTRGFIAVSGLSAVLATVVAIRSTLPWRARTHPKRAWLSRLLAASGVGAGAWALLDLAGWL